MCHCVYLSRIFYHCFSPPTFSYFSRLHLSRRRLSRYSLKSIMISWNIPISSNFYVKLEPLSRCRLSRHDGQVDLLILPHVGSVIKLCLVKSILSFPATRSSLVLASPSRSSSEFPPANFSTGAI